MPFRTVTLQPGVSTILTPTANKVMLAVSNLIRFYGGMVQKMGGWLQATAQQFVGVCRGLFAWADDVGNEYLAIGTNQRLEVYFGGSIYDITPVGTTTNPAVSFSTVISTAAVTITDAVYNPSPGDWINLLTQVSVGGIVLFGFYQVVTVPSGTTYTITAASPATATATNAGAVPNFGTTNTFATVNVTLNNHGLSASGSFPALIPTTVGGLTISGTYSVTIVTNANVFVITAGATATGTTSAYENAGNARIEYLLPSGYAVNTQLRGYGLGLYGEGLYGDGGTGQITSPLRLWSFGNWGEDLIASPTNGMIYYWVPPTIAPAIPIGSGSGTASFAGNVMDVTAVASGSFDVNQTVTAASVASGTTIVSFGTGNGGTGTYNLSTAPGSIGAEPVSALSSAPIYNTMIFIMPQVQIIVSLGAETGGVQEPLLIRWCDQGDFNDWTPSATNQAGSYFLPSGSYLVAGLAVGLGALIWTDVDLWSMTYLGFPLVFGFNRLATRCDLIGQNAVGIIGTLVMWLSKHGFFSITAGGGTANPMECSVWDFFVDNYDSTQLQQIFCAAIPTYHEFIWFFPIAPSSPIYSASAPIAYVKYNFVENAWDYGQSSQFQRTAWVGHTPAGVPVAADTAQLLQQQETGNDANGAPMIGGWQTGYFDAADGEDYPFIDLVIPDFILQGAVAPPIISMNLLATNYPLPSTTSLNVGPFTINTAPGGTQFIPCRVRARQIALAASWSDLGSFNRIGAIRFRVAPDGRA